MSNFQQILAKYSSSISSEKIIVKNCIQKVSYLQNLLNELHLLISSLVKSYKTYGEKHLMEFESLETYKKSLDPRISLKNLLSTLSSYSKHIGIHYIMSIDSYLEVIQIKSRQFLFEIENFNLVTKARTIKQIEDLTKTLRELSEISHKIEENARKHEEIKILVQTLEENTINADKKQEKQYKDHEIAIYKEIVLLEKQQKQSDDNVKEKISSLRTEVLSICEKFSEIEAKCTESIEFIINKLSELLLQLLEFRKETSERLNSTLAVISLEDSESNTLGSPLSSQKMLEISSQKIEILTRLKNSLNSFAECENSIPLNFAKLAKQSLIFRSNTELATFTLKCLEDIQDSIKIQRRFAEEVQAGIIKPIESLIRVQTALNSSLQVSIKNISINFKKTTEHFLNSPNRLSTTYNENNEKLKGKVMKLKENQSKQINSLLNDHVNKENSLLFNVKQTLSLMHEKNVKAYEEVNELLGNVNVSFKTQSLINSGFGDLLVGDKVSEDPVTVLRKFGRNEFKVMLEVVPGTDNDEFARRFDRNNAEPVIDSFLCALIDGILLQGKMYITASYLAFYSHFNSSTILGNVTALKIPISSIQSISKEKAVLILDNSLSIKTPEKSYFFTSFISRDTAHHILQRLISLNHKHMLRDHNPIHLTIETRKPRLKISKSLKINSESSIKMFPDSYYTTEIFTPEVEFEVPLTKVYQLLYSNNSTFYKEYIESTKDSIEELTPWSSSPPDYFSGIEGSNWNKTGTRIVKIRHELKERLPLMPTHCLLVENQTIYFVDCEKFVIEVEFEVNAPYGEYFKTYMRWSFVGTERTKVRVQYGMVFSSYTIFKGKIIKEGTKETLMTLNSIWKSVAYKFLNSAGKENVAEPVCEIVVKEVVKYREQWELWAIISILLLILIKLWQKVKSLETALENSQCGI